MCLDCPIINNMVSVIKTDFKITSLVFRISVILTLVFEVFTLSHFHDGTEMVCFLRAKIISLEIIK
jgi:hypothetical protein